MHMKGETGKVKEVERTWMMSMGRAEGQPGSWVRGYMWVNQLTASLSRPFSFGNTTCLGVPEINIYISTHLNV